MVIPNKESIVLSLLFISDENANEILSPINLKKTTNSISFSQRYFFKSFLTKNIKKIYTNIFVFLIFTINNYSIFMLINDIE